MPASELPAPDQPAANQAAAEQPAAAAAMSMDAGDAPLPVKVPRFVLPSAPQLEPQEADDSWLDQSPPPPAAPGAAKELAPAANGLDADSEPGAEAVAADHLAQAPAPPAAADVGSSGDGFDFTDSGAASCAAPKEVAAFPVDTSVPPHPSDSTSGAGVPAAHSGSEAGMLAVPQPATAATVGFKLGLPKPLPARQREDVLFGGVDASEQAAAGTAPVDGFAGQTSLLLPLKLQISAAESDDFGDLGEAGQAAGAPAAAAAEDDDDFGDFASCERDYIRALG